MLNHENINSPYRMIRIKQVIELTSLSRSTIHELKNIKSKYYDPTFPKSVALSSHTSAWVLQDVERWLVQRIEKSHGAMSG